MRNVRFRRQSLATGILLSGRRGAWHLLQELEYCDIHFCDTEPLGTLQHRIELEVAHSPLSEHTDTHDAEDGSDDDGCNSLRGWQGEGQ